MVENVTVISQSVLLFCSTGKYVFIETSLPSSNNDRAQLRSRMIGTSCKPCKFNFWYHMYGSSVNSLSVYMQPISGPRQTLWTKSGNQGNRWIKASADLVSAVPYQVIIEAVAGRSWTGDIAVDDITLTNCPPVPTPTPMPPCSPSTEFTPFRSVCYPLRECIHFRRHGSRRLRL